MTTADPARGETSWLRGRGRAFARYRVLWILLLGVFLLDQVTKYWTASASGLRHGAYPPFGGIEVIPGFLSLVYATNEGAAWGMLAGHGQILAILAVLTLVALYIFRRQLELQHGWVQVTFGLAAGGILGNLVDRSLHGHVIDFIDVNLGFYRWPTFNVADSGIVAGVLLYFVYIFFIEPRNRGRTRASRQAPNTMQGEPQERPQAADRPM